MTDIFEHDEYTTEEEQAVEADIQKVLTEWRSKVVDADNAKQWLHTNLGHRILKALKANQIAAMKRCVRAKNPEAVREAQYDYDLYCSVETIIGSIIIEGEQALAELESRQHD